LKFGFRSNLSVTVERHMGFGDGLFTRSDSAAHPLFAERLAAILKLRVDGGIYHDGCRIMSNEIAVLKREEGIGRPRNPSPATRH